MKASLKVVQPDKPLQVVYNPLSVSLLVVCYVLCCAVLWLVVSLIKVVFSFNYFVCLVLGLGCFRSFSFQHSPSLLGYTFN